MTTDRSNDMSDTQQQRQIKTGRKQVLGMVLLLAFALPGNAQQRSPSPPNRSELASQAISNALSGLVEAVRTHDDASLDAAICNDLRARTKLFRETRLGLAVDPEDQQALLASQQQNRSAVYRHFETLSQAGRQINALELSRLQLVDPSIAEQERLLLVQDGEETAYPITAKGIIGVTCQPGDHVFDVTVMQVDNRWCLRLVSP